MMEELLDELFEEYRFTEVLLNSATYTGETVLHYIGYLLNLKHLK